MLERKAFSIYGVRAPIMFYIESEEKRNGEELSQPMYREIIISSVARRISLIL